MQQTVGGSVIVWWCISCDGVGLPLAKIDVRLTGQDYIDLLSANSLPHMSVYGA